MISILKTIAQLVECFHRLHKAQGLAPMLYKLSVAEHSRNLSTQEVEAEGFSSRSSSVGGEFKANLS